MGRISLVVALGLSLAAVSSGSSSQGRPAASNGLIAYTVLFRVPGEKSPADYIYGLCIRDRLGASRRLTAVRLHADESAAWSPDGRELAFDRTDDRGASAILVLNAKGERRNISGGSTLDTQPSWSPDGSKLVFVQKPGDLFVMNADGSGRRLLVPRTTSDAYAPEWSPDGARIAFVRGVVGGSTPSNVMVVDADGTGERKIAEGTNPTWAPDGLTIAFEGPSDFEPVFVNSIGLDGRNLRRLTEGFAPVWSPDGSQIMFSREHLRPDAATASDFYVMAANGSGVKPLLRSPMWNFDAAWQPLDTGVQPFPVGGGPPCVVSGTEHADVLTGSKYDDFAYGFGGHDLIRSGAGDDVVNGNEGADLLDGGSGADRIAGAFEADRISGGPGNDSVFAGGGDDVVFGGSGSDRIFGGTGRDRLFGGAGNDTIVAIDGNRELVSCGRGQDLARLDRLDRAAADCERVERH
jgi:Ca2+-binding RTX toxin-like protein